MGAMAHDPDRPRILPPIIAALCLIGAGILQAGLKAPRLLPPNWWWAGIFSVAAGLLVGGRSFVSFHQAGTPPDPRETPTALVTTGMYAVTRNPMYMGMALILLGIALWRGDVVLLASPVAFVLIINTWQIPREERRLAALFGAAYTAYRGRVRRWI